MSSLLLFSDAEHDAPQELSCHAFDVFTGLQIADMSTGLFQLFEGL